MQKISDLIARFPLWIALVSGGLSAFGFAPWGLWPLTLVCFALLIHLVTGTNSKWRAFLTGYLFGIGHFTVANQWIAVAFTFQAAMPIWLGYFAVFALSLYIAVYPALATLGAWWISKRVEPNSTEPAFPLILAFAGSWVITEWMRSWVFTGFVWNPLGVVAVDVAYIAKVIGTYGYSALIVMCSGGIALLFARRLKASATLLVPIVAIGIFSWTSILSNSMPSMINPTPAITIVQPNISQADKYEPGYDAINFHKLAKNSLPRSDQGARLLLWPEAAIPDYLEDGYPFRYYQFQPGESAEGARARLTRLMGDGDVLITGANRLVVEKGQLVAARNSVSAMDANGKLLGHYDKAHLVPYGEYLPMPWLLRPLGLARLVPGDLDFWPGPGAQTMTFSLNGKPVKVGMQICYEIIFSGEVADAKNRPDFIFNPSNDAWFGRIGPPQHLAQARLRAIEEGIPVIRSTPTGISAVIDADGRIVESLPMGTAGRIDAVLPQAREPTLFARCGNILPLAFAVLLIAAALFPLARRRASR